ncbi:MAG TPA: ABC transporter permease [Candidatus Sulfopaludibacter sp.]|jgi:predicted permease|nr:ABC transporter permease [Candidatus Sulfopaludibacter sp.]
MNEFLRRLRYLVFRRRFQRELDSDMEFHREMAAGHEGVNFGSTLRLREESRDAWGWTWLDRFFQDVRFAARMLRRSPGFTLAAMLMLAIGIGVNVAVFGFFDLMVLRPLDVRDPATLLRFHRRAEQSYAYAAPYPEMVFFREHTRTLKSVLAVNTTRLAVEGEERQINVQFVSANLFRDLGATPVIGRLLDPDRDEAPAAGPVVVLGYGFWQRHFGGDAAALGRSLRLNGKPATIVGVASPRFSGLRMDDTPLWAPVAQQPYYVGNDHLLTDYSVDSPGVQVWGRLAEGVAPAAAEAELTALAAELYRQHPKELWDKERIVSEPGGYATSLMIGNRSGTGSEGRNQMLPVYELAVALSLLILAIACANLGSLLLARGVTRQREIAIRTAVGAGRGRLIRQLLTESLLLALSGSAAGLGLGYLVVRGLLLISRRPAWLDPVPDGRVIAFAAGAGLLSAILFGLAPAVQVARQQRQATKFRQFLVGAQVAASCVLLIVAGLLGRALTHAASSDPGFDYEHVLSVEPGLSRSGYSAAKAQAYLETLTNRLRGLPGVQSVSLTQVPPLGRVSISAGATLDGRQVNMMLNRVDSEFFQTMQIPLLRGRNLAPGDAHAMVVGESLARAAWPGQDPIGKTLNIVEDYTVIGVAGTARMVKPEDSDSMEVYLPIRPADFPSLFVVLRTAGPPDTTVRLAAAAARAIDPNTFAEVQLLKQAYALKMQGAEYVALAVGLFGSTAHLLACLGILGVVSYAVSQRTREIGIRMALGADRSHVLSVVLRQFSAPVLAGLTVGVAAAVVLSRFLRGVLYGIDNLDATAYLAAIGIFLATVTLAAVLPARRALRIDPIRALRHE